MGAECRSCHSRIALQTEGMYTSSSLLAVGLHSQASLQIADFSAAWSKCTCQQPGLSALLALLSVLLQVVLYCIILCRCRLHYTVLLQVVPFRRLPWAGMERSKLLLGGSVCKLYHTEIEMNLCSDRSASPECVHYWQDCVCLTAGAGL